MYRDTKEQLRLKLPVILVLEEETMAAADASQVGDYPDKRSAMVEKIFHHFDADGDGGLDREEMAALVVALNPGIKFTEQQIQDIVDPVFQFYSKAARVTLGGLLCIYEDIAGDVSRGFNTLGLAHISFSVLDRLPSTDSSLASSSFRSEVTFDYGGYALQSEVEEIPSSRWLTSLSLTPQRRVGGAGAPEGRRDHSGRGGIRKLGTFYGLANLRRRNR